MDPKAECEIANVRHEYTGERYLKDEYETQEWLGLNDWQWDSITCEDNSLDDLRLMVKNGIPGGYEDEDEDEWEND